MAGGTSEGLEVCFLTLEISFSELSKPFETDVPDTGVRESFEQDKKRKYLQ